jgi:hypothetical protein
MPVLEGSGAWHKSTADLCLAENLERLRTTFFAHASERIDAVVHVGGSELRLSQLFAIARVISQIRSNK